MYNKFRIMLERAIVRRVINDLLKAGYTLAYSDEDEDEYEYINDSSKKTIDALFYYDELFIRVLDDCKYIGGVYLVFGNCGFDTVSDYTVNLEKDLSGALKLANWMEEKFV